MKTHNLPSSDLSSQADLGTSGQSVGDRATGFRRTMTQLSQPAPFWAKRCPLLSVFMGRCLAKQKLRLPWKSVIARGWHRIGSGAGHLGSF